MKRILSLLILSIFLLESCKVNKTTTQKKQQKERKSGAFDFE